MPIALICDNDNHRLTQPQNQFVQILIECFSGSINSSWAYRWACMRYTGTVFYVKERVNTSTKIINMIVCSVEPTKPTEWHAKAKYKKSVHLPVFSSFAARYLCRFNQITYLHTIWPSRMDSLYMRHKYEGFLLSRSRVLFVFSSSLFNIINSMAFVTLKLFHLLGRRCRRHDHFKFVWRNQYFFYWDFKGENRTNKYFQHSVSVTLPLPLPLLTIFEMIIQEKLQDKYINFKLKYQIEISNEKIHSKIKMHWKT